MKTTIVILLLLLGISGTYHYQHHKYRDARKWHHQMEARKELLAILHRARWIEGPISITNDYFTLSNVVIINGSSAPGVALNGNYYAAHNLYSFGVESWSSVGSITSTNFPASNRDTTETK